MEKVSKVLLTGLAWSCECIIQSCRASNRPLCCEFTWAATSMQNAREDCDAVCFRWQRPKLMALWLGHFLRIFSQLSARSLLSLEWKAYGVLQDKKPTLRVHMEFAHFARKDNIQRTRHKDKVITARRARLPSLHRPLHPPRLGKPCPLLASTSTLPPSTSPHTRLSRHPSFLQAILLPHQLLTWPTFDTLLRKPVIAVCCKWQKWWQHVSGSWGQTRIHCYQAWWLLEQQLQRPL